MLFRRLPLLLRRRRLGGGIKLLPLRGTFISRLQRRAWCAGRVFLTCCRGLARAPCWEARPRCVGDCRPVFLLARHRQLRTRAKRGGSVASPPHTLFSFPSFFPSFNSECQTTTFTGVLSSSSRRDCLRRSALARYRPLRAVPMSCRAARTCSA